MNEKMNQIIDEAYKNYQWKQLKSFPAEPDSNLSKEEFINKCKTDKDFSERWGLKIEERELSLDERNDVYKKQWELGASELSHDRFDSLNIPTRLITITYNNTKTEIYE